MIRKYSFRIYQRGFLWKVLGSTGLVAFVTTFFLSIAWGAEPALTITSENSAQFYQASAILASGKQKSFWCHVEQTGLLRSGLTKGSTWYSLASKLKKIKRIKGRDSKAFKSLKKWKVPSDTACRDEFSNSSPTPTDTATPSDSVTPSPSPSASASPTESPSSSPESSPSASPTLPLVAISVLDGSGDESGPESAVFVLSRSGGSASALTVSLTIGGSATNGADYQAIASTRIIPAGVISTRINVNPIDDLSTESTESVIVTIASSSAYVPGSASSASVNILDDDIASPTPPPSNIVLNINASRLSGVAPLSVSFDARGTTGLSNNDFVAASFLWNFGDSASATWSTSGKSKNQDTGFIAGHLFENPGTYSVSLAVTDAQGNQAWSAPVTIQVTSPQSVYTQTYCVSSTGTDTSCAPGAIALSTLTQAFAVAGPNKRILFRRGDSWSFSQSPAASNIQGPCLFGAYGSGAQPRLTLTVGGVESAINLHGSRDLRFIDINLQGPDLPHGANAPIGYWAATESTLFSHVTVGGFDREIHLPGFNSGPASFNFIHESQFGNTGYFSLTTSSATQRLHILGNYFSDDVAQGHVRLLESQGVQIAHNLFDGSFSIKSHSNQTVISDNFFNGGVYARVAYGTGGSNVPCDAANKLHHLLERNIFNGISAGYQGGAWGIDIGCGGNFVFRNNVFSELPSAFYVNANSFTSGFSGPTPLRIYNNLSIDGRPSTSAGNFINISANHPNMDVRNNLVHFPLLNFHDGDFTSAISKSDTSWGGITMDYNLWHMPGSDGPTNNVPGLFVISGAYPNRHLYSSEVTSQSVVPYVGTLHPLAHWLALGFDSHTLFSNPQITALGDGIFSLAPSSPARDSGARDVPVFLDFNLVPRSSSDPISIGPFE